MIDDNWELIFLRTTTWIFSGPITMSVFQNAATLGNAWKPGNMLWWGKCHRKRWLSVLVSWTTDPKRLYALSSKLKRSAQTSVGWKLMFLEAVQIKYHRTTLCRPKENFLRSLCLMSGLWVQFFSVLYSLGSYTHQFFCF